MKNRRKRNQKECPSCFGSHCCGKRVDHPGPDHECDCGMRWSLDEPGAFTVAAPPGTPRLL